jgi:hypothetical protein
MSDLSPLCASKPTSDTTLALRHSKLAIDPTIYQVARRWMTVPPTSISLHLPAHQSMMRTRSSQ